MKIAIESTSKSDLNATQLTELCAALGWQGGTYHQVLAAVKCHYAALNKIAECTSSDDPCRRLVQVARDALRDDVQGPKLDPRCAWPFACTYRIAFGPRAGQKDRKSVV